MNFEFTENSVIVIPITYRGYRLGDGEKVRFRCLFKNYEGDFPYTLDIEEDNKGESGEDGKYTITLDMGRYSISPGRYSFDLSLVLESGSLITIKTKSECHINVIPAEEGLIKPNGEVFFGADFVVEEGKSGIWSYRKWASGIAECWGRVRINSYYTDGLGDDYKNVAPCNIAFPFVFAGTPTLSCSGHQQKTWGSYLGMAVATNDTASAYMICNHEVDEEFCCWFNFQINGRWK